MNLCARIRVAAAGALVLIICGLASPVHAAGESNIDYVEADDDGSVSLLLSVENLPSGVVPDLDSVAVQVEGDTLRAQASTVDPGQIERTTVLALDSSKSMSGERFEAAKSAAKAFLDAAPDDVKVGLLTFSGETHELSEPTTDHAAVSGLIDEIDLTLGTQIYDAVRHAIKLAGDSGARSVLLLSDGEDTGKGASLKEAVESVRDSGTVVDVVAVDQDEETRDLLAKLTEPNGGHVVAADDPAALESSFAAQGEALASQLLVTFPYDAGTTEEASIAVSVAAGGETYTDSAFVTLARAGGEQPLQVVQPRPPWVNETGLFVGGSALGVGLTILLGIVLLRKGPQGSFAEQQLAFYSGAPTGLGSPGKHGKHAGAAPSPSLRESAVALTEKVVQGGDFETRLAQRLAGAGVALTAAEWLLLHAGIAVGGAFVGMVLGGPKLLVLLLLAGAALPWLFLKRKHSKRLAAFNGQLAETLQLISGGLSAGLSLPQGIDTVVREGQEPMSGELRRALMEARLGVDMEDALDGVADRMESEDFSWVVMAIRIQREVGGNLAELLNTVSDTLRERDYLRRQVRVLSAEGRMSAYVLGGLPIVMFLYMLLVRPDAIRPLYTEPLGMLMAVVAIAMLIAGFFTLSKLVKVEV